MTHPFIQLAKQFNKQMLKDIKNGIVWLYSNSGCKQTFENARNQETYKTNCAKLIVWIFKAYGILGPGQTFYGSFGNIIWSGDDARNAVKEKCDIIPVYGKTVKTLIDNKIAQPGDVFIYQDLQHTNMLAYHGKFYDAGHAYCKVKYGENVPFVTWYGSAVHAQQRVALIIRLKKSEKRFHVQCGPFLTRKGARNKLKKITSAGFEAIIAKHGIRYVVEIGSFKTKKDAESLKTKINQAGLTCKVVVGL